MKLYQIFEARRNPHLNPKSDFVSELYYMMHKYRDNLFVSFTHLNKIGVNPQSKFNTPLGVYAYPASYVQKVLEERRYDVRNLPFAGDRPYVQFLESRGRGLDFDHYSYHDLEKDLGALFHFTYDVKMSHQSFEEILKIGEIKDVSRFNEKNAATFLWTITYIYSMWYRSAMNSDALASIDIIEGILRKNDDSKVTEITGVFQKSLTINWNTIINKVMGYDYVVDFDHGIIHQSEPSQVVFLTNRGYKHVGVYELGQEGAEKTADKYTGNEFLSSKDLVNKIKQDFPNFEKNTRIWEPSDTLQNATIDETLKFENGPYGNKVDRNDLLRKIRWSMITQEISEKDYYDNVRIFSKYKISIEKIFNIVGNRINFEFGKGHFHSEKSIEEVRKKENNIIEDVNQVLVKRYNIEEWQ